MALSIKGLSKDHGVKSILREVDLDIASGCLVAILGASGSGKTTLLRLIAGFDKADAGTIRCGDRLVAASGLHVPPEGRGIGYVAQEGALFPHLSVADNIVFGLPRAERRSRERVSDLLALVGLPADFAPRPPHQLSGGEQQRVALARALAPGPSLVLLDEPFSALDTALRGETRAAVAQALGETGATAILVTHDQSEALSMGDPVAVLRDGRLVQVASSRDLYAHPADADLARFLGSAVVIPGVARGRRITCRLGELTLGVGMQDGSVDVMIRPEQIRLATTAIDRGIPARVENTAFYGHYANVLLSFRDSADTTILAQVAGFSVPERGAEVWLSVDGDVVAYPRDAGHVIRERVPCRVAL